MIVSLHAPVAPGARALRPTAPLRRGVAVTGALLPRPRRVPRPSHAVAAPGAALAFAGGGVPALVWATEAASKAATAPQPWTTFLSPEAFAKSYKGPFAPRSLGLTPPSTLEDARTRLVCNPLRFAANYAVLAAAATALALCALARPLELLLGAAVALALFAGGSQRFFDAAWPHLHRWAVFDIMGEPLLVDGVCVKLNGRNVGDEQTLWGLPRLVWGFASAALAAVIVARDPLSLVRLAAGAVCSSGTVVLAHALLKPLPESGEGSWRQTQMRLSSAAVTRAAPSAL